MSEKIKLEAVAHNGLLSRRHLLGLGAGSIATLAGNSLLAADNQLSFTQPEWSLRPGPGASAYGERSPHTSHIQRMSGAPNPTYPGGGASRTPLEHLQGTITPNSLHFERHHAGVPAIDPTQHKLVINGLVRQALAFSYEDLLRYPMVSRIHFLECSGNSGAMLRGNTPDSNATAQSIHGLVSCAEWTGIPLSILLDEAGVRPEARWLAAVGADAASMGRSVPIAKAMDDVLVALYQNGEPIRPEQGYPMRLFVPGWEGNISVKWLTQLKLLTEPAQFRDETSKYTDTLPDRSSLQFTYPMGVKSLITSPSGMMNLRPGIYQVSGIAWSGSGQITRVEVSADGGASWADAELDGIVHDRALTRFRIPWQWQGASAVLLSRATDSSGNVQPSRASLLAEKGNIATYHNNAMQSWAVTTAGEVRNVYA